MTFAIRLRVEMGLFVRVLSAIHWPARLKPSPPPPPPPSLACDKSDGRADDSLLLLDEALLSEAARQHDLARRAGETSFER